MRQPDFPVGARALAPTAATAPTAAANGGAGAGFGSVFRQVQNEIAVFIERGAGATAATTLSPEARARFAPGLAAPVAAEAAGGAAGEAEPAALRQEFLAAIKPWAREAGQRLGVAPEIVAAHAALESGWGRRPLRGADGADSNNLFGLKAGGAWRGAVADAATTEYEHGAALAKTERFRSYPDQASAFRDYAELLLDNPRYRGALNAGGDARAFAQGLARGGYATDPAYADKLAGLAARLRRASTYSDD